MLSCLVGAHLESELTLIWPVVNGYMVTVFLRELNACLQTKTVHS